MKDGIVKNTIEASLFIQIFTLLLNLYSFFIPVDKWDFALKEILGLETFVQVIELLFYTWYRGKLVTNSVDITEYRYYDWFLTTPTMLFSTASYYGYLESREKETKEPFSVTSFFKENIYWILLLFLLNALMLLFGYLQEIGMISILCSSVFGYLSLVGSFSILYKFVSRVESHHLLYKLMFSVWSLYGVAALLPAKEKNIGYNILDVFSKNFYGMYLSYIIYKRKV